MTTAGAGDEEGLGEGAGGIAGVAVTELDAGESPLELTALMVMG